VLVALKLAGEDTTVHVLAYGRPGGRAAIDFVPDPRNRDDQYALFERLGDVVERYYDRCRAQGSYPRIVVPADPNAEHLDVLADRLRFQQASARARRLGELLTYPAERMRIQGQQTLVVATQLIRHHWLIGQAPGEDAHLGVLRARLDPPPGIPLLAAVEAAELQPMGCTTDPEFDRTVLAPLVEAYNRARRAKAAPAVLNWLSDRVRAALEPVVLSIYDATQWAIARVDGLGLRPLPSLTQLDAQERRSFEYCMDGLDRGMRLPLRDRPRGAARGIVERETAVENVEAMLTLEEPFVQAQALLDGSVVSGVVSRPSTTRVGPRRIEYRFDLTTPQPVLRVRERDELVNVDAPQQKLLVEAVRPVARSTTLTLRISAGMRSIGLPSAGSQLHLAPAAPNWFWTAAQRKQIAKRTTTLPWTHDAAAGVPVGIVRSGAPVDPLAAVEALR
jgi:hypothetical protein